MLCYRTNVKMSIKGFRANCQNHNQSNRSEIRRHTADFMIVDQGRNPPLSLAATQRGCTKNNNTSRF